MTTDRTDIPTWSWPCFMKYLRGLSPRFVARLFMRGADQSFLNMDALADPVLPPYLETLESCLRDEELAGLFGLPMRVDGGWNPDFSGELAELYNAALATLGSTMEVCFPSYQVLHGVFSRAWTGEDFSVDSMAPEGRMWFLPLPRTFLAPLRRAGELGLDADTVRALAADYACVRAAGAFYESSAECGRDFLGWPLWSRGYSPEMIAPFRTGDFVMVFPPEVMAPLRPSWPAGYSAVVSFDWLVDGHQSRWTAVTEKDVEEACRGRLRRIPGAWSAVQEQLVSVEPSLMAQWLEQLPAEINPEAFVRHLQPAPEQLDVENLSWN